MSDRILSLSLACLGTILLAGCGDDGRETATADPTNVSTLGPTNDPASTGPTTTSPSTGEPGTTIGDTTGVGTTVADATSTSGSTGPVDPTPDVTTEPPDPSTTTTGPDTTGPDPTTMEPPPECSTVLKATVRDFRADHPDFEDFIGDDKGIVLADLGADKKPVYASAGTTPTTTGAGNYNQWYNDVGGVNLAFAVDIPLTEVMPGQYTYDNSNFFPVDGQGFGEEGNPHNFHFTTEIHTDFTYQGGEVFTFTGDDDLWLFINNKLAIDLGGVHGAESQAIDLDASAGALGIQVGGQYAMDIFHAERHTSQSNFRVDTSIMCFIVPG